jgi:hypothetical protein
MPLYHSRSLPPFIRPSVLDAVAAAVRKSRHYPHRYWLDMQSGVRTAGRFDLDKVECVLRAVARRLTLSLAVSGYKRLPSH